MVEPRLHLLPGGGHLVMFGTESAGAACWPTFSSDSLDGSIAWTTGLLAAERSAAA